MRPVLRIPRPAWEAWAVVGDGWDSDALAWTGTRVLNPTAAEDRRQALHELQVRVLDVDVPGDLVWADSPIVDSTPDRRIWAARLPGTVVAAGPAHVRYGHQLPAEARDHVLQVQRWRSTGDSLRDAIEAALGVTIPPRLPLLRRGVIRRIAQEHPDAVRILRRLRRALDAEEELPPAVGTIRRERAPRNRAQAADVIEADDLAPPLWAGEIDVMQARGRGSIT